MSVAIIISISISLTIVGIFYVLMCTSPSSNANVFLQSVLNSLSRIPGGTTAISICKDAYNYMFWKRNPILQIVYLGLLSGGYGIAVSEIFPLVPNMYLSEYHIYTFSIVFALTLITFYLACTTPPGYITKENIQKYNKYPYDFKIFTPTRYAYIKLCNMLPLTLSFLTIILLTTSHHITDVVRLESSNLLEASTVASWVVTWRDMIIIVVGLLNLWERKIIATFCYFFS